MVTVILFLLIFGGVFLFKTSKKVELNEAIKLENLIQDHSNLFKKIGIGICCFAIIPSIFQFGKVAGGLFWLFSLMTILGILIIASPLIKDHLYKYILIFLSATLVIEFL